MEDLRDTNNLDIDRIFVSGINYKKAAVEVRSAFALDETKQEVCIAKALEKGFSDFVILNTCNRTEIYGIGQVDEAEKIILEVCGQEEALFDSIKSVKRSESALRHIFNVASGLESQILGDYEILGQFKKACKVSKKSNVLSPLFERMANTCIQASKEIKTRTELSKGTVSTSYAVIEVIKENFNTDDLSILLIGTGKIGQNIAKNLHHYLPESDIYLSNRTREKAEKLALEINAKCITFNELSSRVGKFDVVITCTVNTGFDHKLAFDEAAKTVLILDVAVPFAIERAELKEGIRLLNIDDISEILNNSIEQRKLYLPIAHDIINQHLVSFREWYKLYQNRDRIKKLKELLNSAAKHCPHLDVLDEESKERMVNKTMHEFIEKMREDPDSEIDFKQIIDNFKSVKNTWTER